MEYLSGRRSSNGISLTWRILSAAAAGRALSLYATSVVGCRPFLCKSNPPSDSPSSPFATRNYSFRSFESVSFSPSLSLSFSLSVPFSRRKSETTTARYLREFEWHGNYSAVSWHTHMHMAKQRADMEIEGKFLRYMRTVAVSIRNGNWKFKSRERCRRRM